MPEYGVFWNTQHYGSQSPVRILDRNKEWFQDGFLIVRGDLPSPRAVVSNCRKCALFRSKRRDGPGVCRCILDDSVPKVVHDLNPFKIKENFKGYRTDIVDRLVESRSILCSWFIDVLHHYPGRSHNDFRLRIVTVIRGGAARVKLVAIEGLMDRRSWRENPWVWHANEWNRMISEENKAIIEENWRYKKTNPTYAGVAVVVVGFQVHCLGCVVLFEVQLEIPFKEPDLARMGGPVPVHLGWAGEIADSLSDEPTWPYSDKRFKFFNSLEYPEAAEFIRQSCEPFPVFPEDSL